MSNLEERSFIICQARMKKIPPRRGGAQRRQSRSAGVGVPSQRTAHPRAWRRLPLPRGDSSPGFQPIL